MIVSFNVEDELKKWLDEFNEKLESEIKVCKVGLSKIIGYMIRKAIENEEEFRKEFLTWLICLLYTSTSPRDLSTSRMPSSA